MNGMVDFICMGLAELRWTQNKRGSLQNEKSCLEWDSKHQLPAYEVDTLTIAPRIWLDIVHFRWKL